MKRMGKMDKGMSEEWIVKERWKWREEGSGGKREVEGRRK